MGSHITLYTSKFEAMLVFYRDRLGFPIVEHCDQVDGRDFFVALPGMPLKIVDNDRKPCPELLGASLGRVRLSIEVSDIEETRDLLDMHTHIPRIAENGVRMFEIHDPDGLPIAFLQPKGCSALTGE